MPERFVVLDAMGVLYRHGNVVRSVLIPYLRDHGCTRTEVDIRDAYRRCTLGEISTSELWALLGVSATADDADYCQRHQLTQDAPQLLREVRQAGITPWVLTNDAAPWSERLRHRFGLGGWVERWFVSSEIGARKPDPAAYRALLAQPGLDPTRTIFVDDRPPNLVAARSAGFQPVLLHSDDTDAHPERDFQPPVVHSMAELTSYLVEAT
ncbi:HAD-superfamily hydrolase, subfamily IA, variant 3 [Kribbella flavida DSM 17836]|uniref:HAD-superfamily hydrolase, subfamily IA, variant 3 n=1 Tax=Kribbella flavida (strain DSM 17836 / JCM 10339 / NBRC 14399) TaxID=479435 RepID=D2PR64_KRIFD|nr:HAD-IA family hydrolase [Kribbella flavida]ADB33012.1 HAD-superfamily hydrolase, subfamily IA, variant 3 [Kribbella flavida DSM 17836]